MNKYYIKENNWEKIYTLLRMSPTIRVENERKTRIFAEDIYFHTAHRRPMARTSKILWQMEKPP